MSQFIAKFGGRFQASDKKTIVYDPSALLFLEEVCLFLDDYDEEVERYCKERDASETAVQINNARRYIEDELTKFFPSDVVRLMSSVGARMNLKGLASDIDFGLLVKKAAFNKDKYGDILVSNGYQFKKELFGYYVYTKIVEEIEVEVKLRVYEESIQVIELHERLDALSEKMQNKLAFAKALLVDNEELYGKFKWEIYSAYYVQ